MTRIIKGVRGIVNEQIITKEYTGNKKQVCTGAVQSQSRGAELAHKVQRRWIAVHQVTRGREEISSRRNKSITWYAQVSKVDQRVAGESGNGR